MRYTETMPTYSWYETLIKPEWAPPAALFGPVWSVLYVIIAVSFGYVIYQAFTGKIPYMVAIPFVLNLVFNIAFTPVQFGLKNLPLASIIILLVLVTLAWSLYAIWPYFRWVAIANIPYFAWVSFATVLQLTTTWLNR